MAENNQANAPAQEQDLSEILKVRREKLAALRAEGRDPFQQTRFDVSHHAQDIKDHFDELEGTEVTVGGRLMSKRGMGKVSFCDLQDKSGRIQIYARKDEMDEEEYNRFKKYDIGDIVGVRGEVFRTQRGEMSVRAKEITLLSKSLRPLPEKFHGLQDKELRYRQRYVDLIVNPEVKEAFVRRSAIITEIRRYLDERAFLEVETPVLHGVAGGAAAGEQDGFGHGTKAFQTIYVSLLHSMQKKCILSAPLIIAFPAIPLQVRGARLKGKIQPPGRIEKERPKRDGKGGKSRGFPCSVGVDVLCLICVNMAGGVPAQAQEKKGRVCHGKLSGYAGGGWSKLWVVPIVPERMGGDGPGADPAADPAGGAIGL